MATIAATMFEPSRPAARRAAAAPLSIEVIGTLAAAETIWRGFELDAVMAPYGCFDWVAAMARGLGEMPSVRVAVAWDGAGRTAAILPLVVGRQFGMRVASAVGGKHANFNLPLVRPDIYDDLDPAAARDLLRQVGRALAVDSLVLPHVPLVWNGRPTPFAAFGVPSPSSVWSAPLGPDGEAVLARAMKNEARKKLRNKVRGLAKLGTVEVVRAQDEATVDLVLEAFLRQKEARFRELGIADPFAGPELGPAIRRAALAAAPAIELYGLALDGRVVAVLGGAADRRRFSGMFISFEPGAAARFSPGEILATEVVRDLCRRGHEIFDLGTGEARYKRTICDLEERLVDVVVPVTWRGTLHAGGRKAAVAAKRRLKSDPRAMAMLAAARRQLGRLRR